MVDGVPLVVVGFEGEALFVVGGVGEQGAAGVGVLVDLVPEGFADAGGRAADEDAGGDLHQPAGEEAAQAGGAVGEDDDGHQYRRLRRSCVRTRRSCRGRSAG